MEEEFIIPEINLEELGIERNPKPDEVSEETEIVDDSTVELEDDTETVEDVETEEAEEIDEVHVPVYNWMKDTGFFFNKSEDDLKETPATPEEFFELIEERNNKFQEAAESQVITNITSKLPEYLQKVVGAAIKSPDPIPFETFNELINVAEKAQVSDEDFENEEFSEKYLREDYKDKGLEEDAIDDIIAALKDRDVIGKTAKSTYQKSNKGNEIIDKFVSTIDKKVDDVKQVNDRFKEQTIEAFDNTGWRKDKIQTIRKAYSNGEVLNRLQSMLNSPEAQPYLADFAMFWDGKKLHLDKYSKQAFSTTVKSVEDKISKKTKQYFKSGSGKTKRKEKSNDPLSNMNLDNLQLVSKD